MDRLRADGLIEIDREQIVDNRLRRYYRLTPTGAERLAEEADRLHSNASVARSRLDLSGEILSVLMAGAAHGEPVDVMGVCARPSYAHFSLVYRLSRARLRAR